MGGREREEHHEKKMREAEEKRKETAHNKIGELEDELDKTQGRMGTMYDKTISLKRKLQLARERIRKVRNIMGIEGEEEVDDEEE